MNNSKIIVALDFESLKETEDFLKKVKGQNCRVKVGKELFTNEGPNVIKLIQQYGFEIFLDLKFHDIPNTVSRAIKASCNLGVWMVNVHASGGKQMLLAAREAVDSSSNKPILIAVTILTSYDNSSYQELGFKNNLLDQIAYLTTLSENSGMDGIVCSANDISSIKPLVKEKFQFVTPGIRLANSNDDQKRVTTPEDAITQGSNYLVIGRPITSSEDPAALIEKINQKIN
ncbi:orotidine-5'-phosphate decarboxylase [Methylophilaceae bacterium]|nr:orotidine-5'-phosphate decarboxylase [Methylophilaceae bacterium]